MSTRPLLQALTLIATITIAGCASAPKKDPELDQARADLNSLKANPSVQNSAPGALLDAEQALRRAEKAQKEGKRADRDQQLYLARRDMDIAQTMDEQSMTEQQIRELQAERDRLAAAGESELAKKREELATSQEQLAKSQAHQRELESELAAMEAKRTDRGMLVSLNDILFSTGGATIAPGATPTLDKVVEFLKKNPEQHVVVEGHTDSTGSSDFNRMLSQERADAVKQQIVAQGIDPGRVVAKGYGASRPVASNATSAGRQLNRRVEIAFPDVTG